jgi:hypothetical protein
MADLVTLDERIAQLKDRLEMDEVELAKFKSRTEVRLNLVETFAKRQLHNLETSDGLLEREQNEKLFLSEWLGELKRTA